MENLLRKRLEFIKEHARQLKRLYKARDPLDADQELPPLALVDAAPGEVLDRDGHAFYRIRFEGEDIAEDAPKAASGLVSLFEERFYGRRIVLSDLDTDCVWPLDPGRMCFFDIETTGLAPNTYVFLNGFLFVENDRLVIEQVFARDYAEEAGLLRHLRAMAERFELFVSYNGDRFDVPFVKTRMAVGRIDGSGWFQNLDLYEPARKTFSGVLPNCKLETIAQHLRGFGRSGDIPGRDIPHVYHDYVRTGNARSIKRVLYHNRMDLLGMVFLIEHLTKKTTQLPLPLAFF